VKYMLLIVGTQTAEPPAADGGQGLMEAFMSYHQAVCDAGIMVDSNVLESFETATSVQVTHSGERIVTDGPFERRASTSAATTSSTSLTLMPPSTGRLVVRARGPGESRCGRSSSLACPDQRAGSRLSRGGVQGGTGPAARHARAPVR
jgi:hypothetical protein